MAVASRFRADQGESQILPSLSLARNDTHTPSMIEIAHPAYFADRGLRK